MIVPANGGASGEGASHVGSRRPTPDQRILGGVGQQTGGVAPGVDLILDVDRLGLALPRGRGQPPVAILSEVSVALERGGALVLVGPSGSGKSTLLRCLNRLAEPTSGTVRFSGRDIRSYDPRELRRRASLVMQSPVVFEGTVRDNLCVRPAGDAGDFSPGRLREALGEVGLDPGFLDRDALDLSGGERQRLSIARALLRDPEVLLLDEPTSALDPPNIAHIAETISRLRRDRGLSIVAVTHQPDLVLRLGGRLLYLVAGRVQAIQRVDDLRARAGTDARLEAFLSGERPALPSPA
jgi:ABC-type iron transport system FetAB ATPase subunit